MPANVKLVEVQAQLLVSQTSQLRPWFVSVVVSDGCRCDTVQSRRRTNCEHYRASFTHRLDQG